MSQPDYSCDYPGLVQTDETCYRFTDKSIQASERVLFSNYWREQINQYGIKVNYFVNTYNVLSADNFYGEQPTKTFAEPRQIVLAVTLNENAITLSQFGFESDDEITAYIHISSFYDDFYTLSAYETQYNVVEPKAGDVFELSEYGDDRPNNRQSKFFEITQKIDQDVSQINNLQGHYVFLIKAKRLDYSFEPNIPVEFSDLTKILGKEDSIGLETEINFNSTGNPIGLKKVTVSGNYQVYEDSFAGRLSGGENEESQLKKDGYDQYNVDTTSKTDVFDMSINDTDVYGDYY
jgi:hypothetical protein